jgi:hypothetical protein
MATPDSRPRNRTDPTRPTPERPRRRRRDDDQAPKLLKPRDVAKALGCSDWWVKEQARKGRIPFSWIGGSYRFTHEHLDEIIRAFEHRPVVMPTATSPAASGQTAAHKRQPRTASAPTSRLRARTPRRARQAATDE